MDASRIATAMLSMPSSEIPLGDTAANRDLARTLNKEGAAIVHAHPARFGLHSRRQPGVPYDVAGSPLPRALPALLDLVDPDRPLYGSDSPFTPAPSASAQARSLAETRALRTPDKQALCHGNARRLFSRLK
ncbi:amidohydrolase family protein [Streptomyces broussonetiae]|uniref:Amidohydrolase family protein n=1 Tax=Streptomyces broussonetiae TaxID=2686304 RepID=A0ABV5EAV3_9ACTN